MRYQYSLKVPRCQFKEMDQGHEMRFLVLTRVAKRRFLGLNRMTVHPYPNFPLGFLPSPTTATEGLEIKKISEVTFLRPVKEKFVANSQNLVTKHKLVIK